MKKVVNTDHSIDQVQFWANHLSEIIDSYKSVDWDRMPICKWEHAVKVLGDRIYTVLDFMNDQTSKINEFTKNFK